MNRLIHLIETLTFLKIIKRHILGHNDVVILRDISDRTYIISVMEVQNEIQHGVPSTANELLRMNEPGTLN